MQSRWMAFKERIESYKGSARYKSAIQLKVRVHTRKHDIMKQEHKQDNQELAEDKKGYLVLSFNIIKTGQNV